MLKKYLPHFALLTAMLIWATSFIAAKIALVAYSPVEVMAWRMFFATLVFFPYFRPIWKAVNRNRQWKILFLMVLCEPCFYFLFETQALCYTSASQAGMICASLPIFVSLGAWIILKEKMFLVSWIGFILAIIGIVWLSFNAICTESAPNPILGNCLELCAMLCATGFTISLKKLCDVYSSFHLTAIQSFAGMLFFVPQAMICEHGGVVVLASDIPFWAPFVAIIYLGTIVTLGGYCMYNYGVSRTSAGQASAYTNLIPVLTLIFGVLFLGEVFVTSQYFASLLVICGVILSQLGGKIRNKR